MKVKKFTYYMTCTLSMLVGIWHYFVPQLFDWYSYLPAQYENLIVAIEWTNWCFSVLLFGVSLICLIWGRKAFNQNREAKKLYIFLTLVWIYRACLALFIRPWPLEPVPAVAIGQLVVSVVLTIAMIFVSVGFVKELFNERKAEKKL